MINWLLDVLPAGWFIKLALVRLTSQWRSILTVIVGVLLSAMIGASVPLYTTAVSQVGLAQRLDQNPNEATNIHSRISLTPANLDDFNSLRTDFDNAVIEQVNQSFDPFGGWVDATVRWGESSTLLPVRDGSDIEGVRFRVGAYDDIENYVEIIDGVFPSESVDEVGAIDLEVAIPERVAQELGLAVGDEFVLDQRGWDTSLLVQTRVVGIIRERDLDDAYWLAPSPLRVDSNAQWRIESNLITTRASLERIATEFIPQTRTQIGWRVVFDNQSLPFSLIDSATVVVSDFETVLTDALQNANPDESVSLVYETNLSRVLQGYNGEVERLNVPFSLILLQLGALVIFFLLVMAALVRRGERREISMLQSRGARDRDILLLRGVEMFIISVVAIIVAPIIARQLLIVFMPLFTDIDRLPLLLDSAPYIYASIASVLAFVILMATLIPVMRQPLISAGGSHARGQKRSWWQRYYLDVVILLIGLVALWQAVNTETLTTDVGASDTQADPILLIAPTLLILALGSIALRIFPNVMDFMSRFFSVNKNLLPTLASWQVSREPLHYGRITFLLALAVSIGWFAISFQTIVTGSQTDQALYQLGADVQIRYGDLDEALRVDPYLNLDNVDNATTLIRLENQDIAPSGGVLLNGDILVVDDDTFSEIAFWRDDLGELAIPTWEDEIPQVGEPLPFIPSSIGFWARLQTNTNDFRTGELLPENEARNYSLYMLLNELELAVRLQDADGNLHLIPLTISEEQIELLSDFAFSVGNSFGNSPDETVDVDFDAEIPNGGWVYFEADTSELLEIATEIVYFDTISIDSDTIGFNSGHARNLALTGFTLTDGDGAVRELDVFARNEWETINELAHVPERSPLVVDDLVDADGEIATGLNFRWSQQDDRAQFGLLFNYPAIISTDNTERAGFQTPVNAIDPMPVIISRSFSEETNLTEGQLLRVYVDQTSFWTEVVSVVDYYPTLYNQQSPFLVLNRDILLYTVHRRPHSEIYANEVWLELDLPENADVVSAQLSVDHHHSEIIAINTFDVAREVNNTNLLTLGLIGLLYISFSLALLLSLVSLITYAGLSVQSRQTEFAVLRALGFTTRRVVLSVTIEQLFVMLTAILLGIAIAFILSTQVLPTLSVNTTGDVTTPPFLIQFEVRLLIQYALLIGAILVIELLISAYLIRRAATIHALRQT